MARASVKLVGPGGESKLTLDTDVGSPLTWIDQRELNATGVVPSGFWTFKTRDGALIGRQTGEAPIELLSSRATPVVFAQPNDVQVIGKAALSQLGLEPDEAKAELRKLGVLPAYQLRKEAETSAKSP